LTARIQLEDGSGYWVTEASDADVKHWLWNDLRDPRYQGMRMKPRNPFYPAFTWLGEQLEYEADKRAKHGRH
jgi:hypothetical protein